MKQNSKIRNDKIQKNLTKSSFTKWKKEYEKFMQLNVPFNVEIVPFCNTETPKCWVDRVDNRNIMYVNQLLIPIYGQKSVKSIAFHEFTHAYDNEFLFPEIPMEEKNGCIWGYSEYHATFIQMLCALQFNDITDNPKIEISSKIYIDKSETLKEYLENDFKDIKITLDAYFENLNTEIMIEVFRFMFYSFAKIDFLKKYCPEALDIYNIEKLFINRFGEDVLQIHSLVSNIDTSNYSMFKNLLDKIARMGSDYLEQHMAGE